MSDMSTSTSTSTSTWDVWVTVCAGMRGAHGYENLYYEDHRLNSRAVGLPRDVAIMMARDVVGKTHQWEPTNAAWPHVKFGLIVHARAEDRDARRKVERGEANPERSLGKVRIDR